MICKIIQNHLLLIIIHKTKLYNTMIEIRSNINSMVDDLVQKEAERIEREKQEREAKWAKEREERERLDKEWKEQHPNMDKFTYCSRYNHDTFNFEYCANCNLYFYEWSNIENQPIYFKYITRFYDFLDKCGIILTEKENTALRRPENTFVTCKPGCKTLIIAQTYDDLAKQFNNAVETSKALETVPEI